MTSGQFPLRLATAALASGERRGPELLQERLLPPGAVLQRGGLHFPAAPGTSASSACRLQVGSGGRSAGCCGIIRGQARFLGLLTEAAMAVCWLRPAVTRVFLQSHCRMRLFPPPWARPALCPHCSHATSPRLEKQRTYWQYLRRKILKPPTPPFSHVCRVGDPVLRGVAAPVEPAQIASREVQALIQTLQRVMWRQESVGLSAPQLGVPLQVFVAEFPERLWQENAPSMREARQMSPFPLRVFVNPTMRVLDSRLVSFPEGCESISGFSACVPRYQAVQVSGLNEAGEQTKWQASGWAARILQHEMDHLQGVLYIDKMDSRTFVNVEWDKLYQ